MNLLAEQWVIGIGQLLLGFILKKNPNLPNKFIPIFTYLAAILGFTFLPASAHAASSLPLGQMGNVFVSALFQNLLVTGTHSTFKNTLFPAFSSVIGFLFGKRA